MDRLCPAMLIITFSAAVGLLGTGGEPEPPAPSVSIPTIRPGAVDDSFACLSDPGPLIEIRLADTAGANARSAQ